MAFLELISFKLLLIPAGRIHQLYLQKYNPNMGSDNSPHWWLHVEHKSGCNTERTCAEKWEPIEGMGTEKYY